MSCCIYSKESRTFVSKKCTKRFFDDCFILLCSFSILPESLIIDLINS